MEARDEVTLLSLFQHRSCMVDKKHKGGKSVLLRCTYSVKRNIKCEFNCKIRRSAKDSTWSLCDQFQAQHTCKAMDMAPKYPLMRSIMEHRKLKLDSP
jgi:hypothetical protein